MKRNELALSFRLGSWGVDFEMRLVRGMFIRECSREHLWKEGRKKAGLGKGKLRLQSSVTETSADPTEPGLG